MICFKASNAKLLNRAINTISKLSNISYSQANEYLLSIALNQPVKLIKLNKQASFNNTNSICSIASTLDCIIHKSVLLALGVVNSSIEAQKVLSDQQLTLRDLIQDYARY